MKDIKKIIFTALILLMITPLAISGCSSPEEATVQEGFAIYLTKNDIPVSEMAALSHVELAGEPVISINDIISYSRNTHEIKLTAEAYERVMDLKVPTSGRSFLVCIDKKPIYWGAFWTPFSSLSFDGVTIWVPSFYEQENTIKIELGYPSPSFYQGEDPRSNSEIMDALEKAGKLK